MWLMLFAGLAAAAPFSLTVKEEAQLASGEIVVHHLASETGGGAVAVAEVHAPPGVLLDAVIDFQARLDEVGALEAVDVYDRVAQPESYGVRWTLSVVGSEIIFHARYDVNRAANSVFYALDTSKPNDIVASQGSYVVVPTQGGSRLVYESRMDSGRQVPGWLKRWIATSSLTEQLNGIRSRAEAAGSPSKP